jgi:dihydrolipoamide dehydrogenase
MHKQKDDAVQSLVKGIEGLFKKNKIEYIIGHGSFNSDGTIKVASQTGTDCIKAKNVIIATGSTPVPFPNLQFDEKQIVSSTGALSFDKVPKHLVIVGAGIIGLELGSVWKRLGANVTVVEYQSSIGAGMDKSISESFQKILQKQGIKFILNTKVDEIKPNNDEVYIKCKNVTSALKTEVPNNNFTFR